MRYATSIGDQEFLVEIVDERHVLLNGRRYEIDFSEIYNQPVYSLLIDGKSYEAYVYSVDGSWQVLILGRSYQTMVEDEGEKRLRVASSGSMGEGAEYLLKAPMPGLVISVPVSEGQEVQKGEVLAILESMKMQNELKSPRAGTVTRLRVSTGDNVEQYQTMLSVV
jgi:biotin carboxyl carrier protein